MPPSSKRPQRTRREPANLVDVPDSSPSRPAKRRKKVEEPTEKPEPEAAKLPSDRSGLTQDDEELIRAVVPHLTLPETFVQVTRDHANKLHEKHHADGVQAYAKLAGRDWTFYIKDLQNNIGRLPEKEKKFREGESREEETPRPDSPEDKRRSRGAAPKIAEARAKAAAAAQLTEAEIAQTAGPEDKEGPKELEEKHSDPPVHIDLGPNKIFSRTHASIVFEGTTENWYLHVYGRNGVRINNQNLRIGLKQQLISGQILELGGVEMMFVLPEQDGSLKVHQRYLARAGLIDGDEAAYDEAPSAPVAQAYHPNPASQTPARAQNGVPGALPIAPAPPDYRRPDTPASRTKAPYSAGKSPAYSSGPIFMNSENVDLSLDTNKLVKPPFSYAQMISQAILNTREEKLNLNGIYTFITDRYAYYRHQAAGGWQNSIRHNLSLNKAFVKVPRSTDEPGKGMKWCIVPEARDDMVRNSLKGGRGGHRGSSVPGSPANLDNLRSSKDNGAPSSGPRRAKRSPSLISTGPQFTPDRKDQLSRSLEETPGDGSPLPPHRRATRGNFTLSENMPGSPPALSSSYQDESTSFVTPAPHRVHPRLAPPSTAQRPSQVMPTSSPAPFWKYADLGTTPMKAPAFESSPIKGSASLPAVPPSSSPPPVRRSSAASPTRNGTSAEKAEAPAPRIEEIEEEDQGFDLTRGFQSIGSFHAPASNGVAIAGAVNGRS